MKKYGNKSLLFGILGIIFCWFVFGIVFSILGLVFSFKGLRNKMEKQGKIVAGLILSILSLIIAIVMIAGLAAVGRSSNKGNDSTPPVSAEAEVEPTEQEQPEAEEQPQENQEEPEEQQISAEEYKAQCQEFNYKDVLRNPDDYVGQKVKVTVKVSSVHQESFGMPKYYFAYANDDMDWWLGDEYGIFEYRAEGDFKILEDDIITVYGEISNPKETKSSILNSRELFCIDMKYADLIEE